MTTRPVAWKLGSFGTEFHAVWPVLRALLLVLGTIGSIGMGRFYGLIALSLVWAPYVFFNPLDGLWVSPGFIMVASLMSPPEGFVEGEGYSPELVYWAIGVCVLFATMLLRYLWAANSDLPAKSTRQIGLPRGLYAFAAVSVIAMGVGLVHGYTFQNVAKQFFGCALLWAYFLFALRFCPTKEQIVTVIDRIIWVAVICSIIYMGFYFALFSVQGFSDHLTAIAAYAGGLLVLLIPRILPQRTKFRMDRTTLVALILFAIPVLTHFKRAVAGCMICGFLAWSLRSKSRGRRYLYLITAFLGLALVLSTSLLNPIGTWLSKYTLWENLFPEDVQSNYSVVTRIAEFGQVMDSFTRMPLLGSGLGSTITWYDPVARTYWDQETLDNGLLYLLAKMGIIGTLAFCWFIGPLGIAALRKPVSGLHLGLFLLMIFHLLQMVADASFFYFMTAGWIGTTCAFLYIFNTAPQPSYRVVAPSPEFRTKFTGTTVE